MLSFFQVLAPNDVQFELSTTPESSSVTSTEEVIIDATGLAGLSEAVCIHTPAFIGITITLLMILIIALITIVFLWMRIKSLDRKSLL